jgi:hypothetical protein
VITNLCACTYIHSNTRHRPLAPRLRCAPALLGNFSFGRCAMRSDAGASSAPTAKGNLPRNSSAQKHTDARTKAKGYSAVRTAMVRPVNVYIYVHLYLFYFIIHVWPLFCTWCLSSIHVISITISTYLDLDLQIGGAWVQSGKALQSSVRIKQWHCTFSQYARYGQINDARCFSVPWTNLCCPLAPGVVLEACLHLVWRILATV